MRLPMAPSPTTATLVKRRASGRENPDHDVGGVEAVRRADVIRAGGGRDDEVGLRPHEHVVARLRERRLDLDHAPVDADLRVVEEVDRLPEAPRRIAEDGELAIEVVGAVEVAGIA